ncbi:MAG TPA: YdeI/OmpD-associated family protein [Candidatus Limnocylindrales bacterium]|nr:YdeI/OmpD-associated family protein [Candidatus Limnocylindrales bacterium]
MADDAPEPIYFESPEELRDWFAANHETASELWLGYWKKASGRPTVTWAQAVDEALCVGWIDTTRYSVDELRSRQRFTPRRKGSNWSAVNIANVERLAREGRMRPAGLRAFEARTEARTAPYSYEQRHAARLTDDELARFRANDAAWTWFQNAPQSYQTGATWWVVNVKRPETRERRLAQLIEASAQGLRPKPLTPPGMNADGRRVR